MERYSSICYTHCENIKTVTINKIYISHYQKIINLFIFDAVALILLSSGEQGGKKYRYKSCCHHSLLFASKALL